MPHSDSIPSLCLPYRRVSTLALVSPSSRSNDARSGRPQDNLAVCSTLPPLPFFATAAAAEQWSDEVALTLGVPVRAGSSWSPDHATRQLLYVDQHALLELTIILERGPVVEQRQSWSMRSVAKLTGSTLSRQTERRLRPSAFRDDARELLRVIRALLHRHR